MGMPGFPFFGDLTKDELEKELRKVNEQLETETDEDKRSKLEIEKAEIIKELETR